VRAGAIRFVRAGAIRFGRAGAIRFGRAGAIRFGRGRCDPRHARRAIRITRTPGVAG
jgi:hypothetical protein